MRVYFNKTSEARKKGAGGYPPVAPPHIRFMRVIDMKQRIF